MGGSAFTTLVHGLSTPRMPPHVYREVMTACHAKLKELYTITASPIESPGKKDFGDIDILVTVKKPTTASPETDTTPTIPSERTTRDQLVLIGEKLQARHSIIHSPPVSANFAVPWPTDIVHAVEEEQDTGERFIQVDIRICKDEEQVNWALFKHAHGDIWNIIGSMIRPYGLTVDEQALCIRIPEIEKFDKKQAKVKLTDKPLEVMDFLGMKYDGFWTQPFESVDALYEYATTCRLFLVRDKSAETGAQDLPDCPGVAGGAEGRKSLKSNDRRRMNQRPIYRNWINEVVPRLIAEGRFASKDSHETVPQMRAMVQQEALERFGVEKEYQDRLRAWRLLKDVERVKGVIKELVPENTDLHYRGTLMSAMKKTILEDDQTFGVLPALPFKKEDGFYDMEAVRAFITEKAGELGEVACGKQCEKSREAMKAKLARRKGQEETAEHSG